MGMRTSLRGTQASGEGESHTQDANVAESAMVSRSVANLSIQIMDDLPGGERFGVMSHLTRPIKVTNGVGGSREEG
jgi:hypothetical protein